MRVTTLLLFFCMLNLGCNAEPETEVQASKTVTAEDCPQAEDSLRNPTTYPGVVKLINALPKPLSANCFLANYDPPFKVFAIDNTFSAQPSAGETSPRIFLLYDDFILSVVPDGDAKDNVEFGKVVSRGMSVKGDIKFPIEGEVGEDAPFSEIMDPVGSTGQTQCRFCHRQETAHSGGGFQSEILAPNSFKRVSSDLLKTAAETCDDATESQRCDMLKLIFQRGEANDVDWPF